MLCGKWAVESTVWTDAIASRRISGSENGYGYFSWVDASFYNRSRELTIGLLRRLQSHKKQTQELATQEQEVKNSKSWMFLYVYILLALLFAIAHCNKN